MLRSILLLLFQGISGGVAGYITNKYAVNMLFKEYTPLKLGGVIKKKKDKFIEEISELVERDIINSETLKAEISNKNFNVYIEQIAETFFQTGLKDSLGKTKVCEVSDFSKSVAKNEEFVRKNLSMILPELLDNIFININLENILTNNQISKIVNSSYDLLVQELDKDNTLGEFISNFYKENSNITLSDICSEQVQKKFIKNITDNIKKIIEEDILIDEEGCKLFFDKILSDINIDSTLIKLQGFIGDYEISQFVNTSEEKEFTSKVFTKIDEFINSQNGKKLIINLMNEILLIGKDIDFTLYEILPPEMENSLTHFIETVIPSVMPYISDWILSNESAIDEMIETAIDEAIENVDGNIKNLIISKVRSALMGDISSDSNVVKRIIDYINNNLNGDSYNKLANSIINYLKEKKIKDVVEMLEKQNLFNSEKLAEIIIKEFSLHGEKILGYIVKAQFSKKVHKVFKFDLVKSFSTKLKPILYENILKNKDKLSAKINNLIEKFISSRSKDIFNKDLSKLLTYDQMPNLTNEFVRSISELFRKNAPIYKRKIEDFLSLKVKNINLLSTVENSKEDILDFVVDNLMVVHKETVDKYKDYELGELISLYFDKTKLSAILINEAYPKLIDNLPNLLDGNIKKFAKSNLNKYDEDQICNIVQEFMGNQLKPLSVFGGVLGVIVGLLYQLIYPNSIGMYGFPSSALNVLTSCLTMAGIGYITNVIALWMIFRPYKENKIIAKIPFFKKFALGYIPAHKNDFAVGMAKLIDEELLNNDEINKVFKAQQNTMQSLLMNLVTNNNYQLLISFIRDKKQDLAKYIYGEILKYCNEDSYLSKRISKAITNTKIDKFIKKDHIINILPNLIDKIKNIQNSLAEVVNNKISKNHKVNDILPEEMSSKIKKYVQNHLDNMIEEKLYDTKNTDYINKIAHDYSDYYDLEIQKSCKEIFSKDYLDNIKNNMEVKVETYMFNDMKIYISDVVKQFLHNELNENKTIDLMFNGKIKKIIDSNLYFLTNCFTDKLISYIKNNQDNLTLTVQETIKNELNFFEKMAYGAFGGDNIAEKVVEIIVNEKLPIMIKDETDKITNIADVALNDSIYPMETSILKIKADEINIGMLFDNIFEELSNNTYARQHICNASNLILDSLISTPIVEYLETFNLHSLDLAYKKFYNEVTIVKEDIYRNININHGEVSRIIGEFLNEKIITSLFNLDITKIFKEITLKDIENSVENILNLISLSKETQKYLAIFLEKIYDNTFSQLQIGQIIDTNILIEDSEKIITSVFNNETLNQINIELIEKIIENAIDNNLDFILDDTKDYLINKIMETGLDSISYYIVPILQEINLKNITNKQIELLNPKEIDLLFNSFAGDFFNKLRIYGVFGFVFGINVGLSIILWVLDLRYSKVYSKKI